MALKGGAAMGRPSSFERRPGSAVEISARYHPHGLHPTLSKMIPSLPTYGVNPSARKPLIDFMIGSLERAGCKIVHQSSPDRAPFVIVFETSVGERMGIVAYAFLA